MSKKAKKYVNNVNINPELNLIKGEFIGILSDTIPFGAPMLISNAKRLEDVLITAIAKKKPLKDDNGMWILEDNNDDAFVNKNYEIDFLKQDIIAVRGVKIEKVNFVEGKYKVTFSNEKLEDYQYFAVIVQAPSGCAKPKDFEKVNYVYEEEARERVFIP